MQPEFSLPILASRLGLGCAQAGDALALQRHGFEVAIPAEVSAHLDPLTALGRHLSEGVFFGIRLAIDHRIHAFDPAEERVGDQALYGERLPRLLTTLSVSWFQALSDTQLFCTDWLLDTLKIAYIFESGKALHALSRDEASKISASPEKIKNDARHALFYDSFKLKPVQNIRHPEGLIRVFQTSEGRCSTRALLLPDFDYDAAREGGCFAIPSRDTLIIGRPKECEDAPMLRTKVEHLATQMLQDAPFPLSETIFDMTHNQVFCGENPAMGAEGRAHPAAIFAHHLPSHKDAIKAVQPPAGVHIYSRSPG